MNNQNSNFKLYTSKLNVRAKPMTYTEYCNLRNWEVSSYHSDELNGYLIEDLNSMTPNHPDFKYYINWLPKEIFEKQYCEVMDSNN